MARRGLCSLRWVGVVAIVVMAAGLSGPPAWADIFTSLETPPTAADIEEAIKRGVTIFDFDLDADGAAAAVQRIKPAGGKITAYHVGGGGGRAWGSVRTGEFVRRYDSPRDFSTLTAEVRSLVAKGASAIHFDNTHRMTGKRLEAIADAIVAGGAGFVAKNNASKWRLVMQRRSDLRTSYAVIEDAMFDAAETQAAYDLFARGVPVYVVGFRKPIDAGAPGVSDDYARAYLEANPWARILLMDDERAYDSRTGVFMTREGR